MNNGKYKQWITPEGLTLIEGWARNGLTDEQISQNIGINKSTLYDWKKKYPEFSNALKKGKEIIDLQVENALLNRALGYEYEETIKTIDDKGKKTIKVVNKHIAGDVTAQIFWLKNRKPERWRDKQDFELAGRDGQPIQTENKVQIYIPDNGRDKND